MSSQDTDKVFIGSIPELYEVPLVPLIFEPYAVDLAGRLASRSPTSYSKSQPAQVLSVVP